MLSALGSLWEHIKEGFMIGISMSVAFLILIAAFVAVGALLPAAAPVVAAA